MGLLFFIVRGNLKNMVFILKRVSAGYFLGAVFLFFVIMVILSYRLKKIMAIQNINIPLKNVTCLSLIGFFFNNFLPTSVAGDIVKAHYTACYTAKTVESYTSVVIDRIFGLISFIFLAFFALLFADETVKSPLITRIILVMIFAAITITLLIATDFLSTKFSRVISQIRFWKLNQKIMPFLNAVAHYKGNIRIILFALYTSIVAQAISVFVVAALAKGLNINISLWLLFLTLPIISVLSMLPSLNGLGIRESAYVFFLGKHVGNEGALAVSILWLGVMLTISFLGGVVYFLRDVFLKNNGAVSLETTPHHFGEKGTLSSKWWGG
jgi:uncharacterized protein (TIRG00374 family)